MPRASFLTMLIEEAAEKGNTIYEELQGDSVIKSTVADWNDIAVNTMKGSAETMEHLFKTIHPTIDAQPGRQTLEDLIDPIIFDTNPNVGPLQLIGLGVASGSRAAAVGAQNVAKQIGFKVGAMFKGHRVAKAGVPVAQEAVEQVATKVVPKVAAKVDEGVTVLEGMAHTQGGASPETARRLASGVRHYRVKPSGVAERIAQGGEDAKAFGQDIIVQVGHGTRPYVTSGGRVSKVMQSTMDKLKPGKIRDITQKVTKLDVDDVLKEKDKFLDILGVKPGRGPKPPGRIK